MPRLGTLAYPTALEVRVQRNPHKQAHWLLYREEARADRPVMIITRPNKLRKEDEQGGRSDILFVPEKKPYFDLRVDCVKHIACQSRDRWVIIHCSCRKVPINGLIVELRSLSKRVAPAVIMIMGRTDSFREINNDTGDNQSPLSL